MSMTFDITPEISLMRISPINIYKGDMRKLSGNLLPTLLIRAINPVLHAPEITPVIIAAKIVSFDFFTKDK